MTRTAPLQAACPRCGIIRQVRQGGTLCLDCKHTLTAQQRTLWTEQKRTA